MSRRPDVLRRGLDRIRRHDGGHLDGGFSLVEVMAAMLIFAIVAVASLGFLINSLSSTALARTDTVAKNLNQELLERMRNLPFFEHANVSTVPDLLDTYYASTAAAAASADSSGFVAAGAPRDTSKGDPATGAFYRTVLAAPPDYPGYTRRVTAQFIGAGTAVLPNPVFVSTSTGSTGLPPSSTLGVRVTTLWDVRDSQRSFTVESQITDGSMNAPRVTLQARLALLRFAGVLPDNQELVAEAGVLNLDGSKASTTVGSAVVQAAQASIANDSAVVGAAGTLAAPPTAGLTVAPLGPQTLALGGTQVAAFSGTSVNDLRVSTDGGQPGVGTAAAPVTAAVTGNGTGSDYFRASNLPLAGTRLHLLEGPVVRASASSCGGDCNALTATGSLQSTEAAAHSSTASLGGSIKGTVSLLPTTTSPDGLVKLTLSSLSVVCRSASDASPPAAVTVSYSGTVSHRTYDLVTGAYGYSAPVTIDATSNIDPLAAIDLQTPVGMDGTGLPLRLSDYIQSWSSLSGAAVTASTMVAADGTAASLTVPGVLTLTTQPLRVDPQSTVGLQIGAASCTAADIR